MYNLLYMFLVCGLGCLLALFGFAFVVVFTTNLLARYKADDEPSKKSQKRRVSFAKNVQECVFSSTEPTICISDPTISAFIDDESRQRRVSFSDEVQECVFSSAPTMLLDIQKPKNPKTSLHISTTDLSSSSISVQSGSRSLFSPTSYESPIGDITFNLMMSKLVKAKDSSLLTTAPRSKPYHSTCSSPSRSKPDSPVKPTSRPLFHRLSSKINQYNPLPNKEMSNHSSMHHNLPSQLNLDALTEFRLFQEMLSPVPEESLQIIKGSPSSVSVAHKSKASLDMSEEEKQTLINTVATASETRKSESKLMRGLRRYTNGIKRTSF